MVAEKRPARPAQPKNRHKIFKTPVIPGHHRLMFEMTEIMERGRWSSSGVCQEAGLGKGGISHWRNKGGMPNIGNFDAVLRVMGYRLAIERIDPVFTICTKCRKPLAMAR